MAAGMIEITLLSWNIFRNYRSRLIELSLQDMIGDHKPDVIFLQEAPHRAAGHFRDLPVLKDYQSLYAPVHVIEFQTRRLDFLSTGQLTLSRLPFETRETYELPALPRLLARAAKKAGRVTRAVPYARIRLSNGLSIGLHNVHLENRTLPAGRLRQVKHLLSRVGEKSDDVTVIGGDFNTFLTPLFEQALHLLARHGFEKLAGVPRYGIFPRLDFVMVRTSRNVACDIESILIKGRGSDHHPVLARIRVGPTG